MDQSDDKAARPASAELDAILGKRFPVLDDGFVRIVDYQGTDGAVVQAARVSYGAGTKSVREDAALIRYLMRHQHTSPFEMCELKLHVRVPMDCWRQWIRHRTANVNEYSTRYSIAIDSAARTTDGGWRTQSRLNRQGSGEYLPSEIGAKLTAKETELLDSSRMVYEERIAAGVAREQARKDLPLSTYTEAFWKCDLHNLLHFLRLRLAPQAQKEIREYARVIGYEIVRRWCPVVWQAFVDYRLEAITLSSNEISVVRKLSAGDVQGALNVASGLGWLDGDQHTATSEGREATETLRSLGFALPWRDK